MHFNTFISKMKLKKLILNRVLVTSWLTSGTFYSPVASMHLAVVVASVCSLLEPWQSLDTCHYSAPPPDAQCPCRWTESWAGLDAGLTLHDQRIGQKIFWFIHLLIGSSTRQCDQFPSVYLANLPFPFFISHTVNQTVNVFSCFSWESFQHFLLPV